MEMMVVNWEKFKMDTDADCVFNLLSANDAIMKFPLGDVCALCD